MLNHYLNTASALSDLEDVLHLELALGGNHGKGAFTFLAVVFVRYSNGNKCNIFEMQVGQIDSASDSAEILKPLLEKLEVALQQMKPDGNGNCKLLVSKDDTNVRSISFEELNKGASDTVLDTEMRLYLIGDLKFLFTMMGRDGYSGAWCIYCVLKQSQWTAMHGDNDDGNCDCKADL